MSIVFCLRKFVLRTLKGLDSWFWHLIRGSARTKDRMESSARSDSLTRNEMEGRAQINVSVEGPQFVEWVGEKGILGESRTIHVHNLLIENEKV